MTPYRNRPSEVLVYAWQTLPIGVRWVEQLREVGLEHTPLAEAAAREDNTMHRYISSSTSSAVSK